MESILKNRFTMLTGWGTGLALLFVFFSEFVSLNNTTLGTLDIALSICVATFFVLTLSACIIGYYVTTKDAVWDQQLRLTKKLQGVICSMVFLLCGWFLLDFAPDTHGAIRTATTLGALISGYAAIAMYMTVIQLFKRKKV